MQQLGVRGLAQQGVLMFFIHTSLVLMMSLERLGEVRTIQRFYVRRAFRIYPLAVLTVLIALLIRVPPHFEPTYEAGHCNDSPQSISCTESVSFAGYRRAHVEPAARNSNVPRPAVLVFPGP